MLQRVYLNGRLPKEVNNYADEVSISRAIYCAYHAPQSGAYHASRRLAYYPLPLDIPFLPCYNYFINYILGDIYDSIRRIYFIP